MGFSEKVKEEARRKAGFRCVICQEPFVEVITSFLKMKGEKIQLRMQPLFVPDVMIYTGIILQKENRSVK